MSATRQYAWRVVRWVSLLITVTLAACSGGTKGIDDKCFEEGRCACRTNADCGSQTVCLNGQCVFPDTDVTQEVTQPDTTPDTGNTTPDTVAPNPGDFLAPCSQNTDCNDELCVAISENESLCSRRCFEDCAEGWACRGIEMNDGIRFMCMPNRERLCEACATDAACPGEGARCVSVGGTHYCGRACENAGDCPSGYDCSEAETLSGERVFQCVPTSNACECSPSNVGMEMPCVTENSFGTCYGVRSCQADGTLSSCSARLASAEICNGVDDDCNGFIDDRVEATACEVTNSFGTCAGERLCLANAGEVCNARTPRAEQCDNLDDDCDGQTDEDFKDVNGQYSSLQHCGACNNSCVNRFPNAVSTRCEVSAGGAPQCVVDTCAPGYVRLNDTTCGRPPALLCSACTPGAICGGPQDLCITLGSNDSRTFCGRDCSPNNIYGAGCPEGYSCRESDFQCVPNSGACDCSEANDGQIRPCSNQNQYGTCFGLATCQAGTGWTACSARTPEAEICNGLDENCDGIADDGLGGAACVRTNNFGSCPGIQSCDGTEGTLVCLGPDAAAEVCNGLDDDCDGEIDEDFATNVRDASGAVVAVKYGLSAQHCGGCNISCTAVFPAVATTCNGAGDQPYCAITQCAPGYYLASDRLCLPLPTNNLCAPCGANSDCQGPGDQCMANGAGDGFCARDCSAGSIYSATGSICTGTPGEKGCCPNGYTCDGSQCLPDSGDCACRVDGATRLCTTSNSFGSCLGVQTCTASGANAGWGDCSATVPGPEICDGIDNNCDGLVDRLDPNLDVSGLDGYPNCFNTSAACSGEWVCGGTQGWLCSAREPSPELCNGIDDDCDGQTDEGFVDANGNFLTVENCGQCGLNCASAISNLASTPNAVSCEMIAGAPTCVPLQCAPGFIPFPEAAPRVCLPLASTSCRPCSTDSECGLGGARCIEMAPGEGRFCAQPCGADAPFAGCTGAFGEQGCCGQGYECSNVGGAAMCMPTSNSCLCSPERVGAVRSCEVGGQNNAPTCFGVETCQVSGSSTAWSGCDTSSNIEVCDGIDNNCNGQVDEGFVTNGNYVSDENCGACGRNCLLAYSPATLHAGGICDAAAPTGPRCVLGDCLSTTEPAGIQCTSNSQCGSGVCDLERFTCETACTSNAQCGSGRSCVSGLCATNCTTNAQCSSFGSQASCVAGTCQVTIDWVDLDGVEGNGCECAAARNAAADRPDIPATDAAAGMTYVDSDCDGIDGDIGTAIFVRSGEVGGNGSYAAPFGTIKQALASLPANASAAYATPILVAGGYYEEAIRLVNGASLHGGYSYDFRTRDVVLYPTVIEAHAGDVLAGNYGTVAAIDINQPTELIGFTIVGWDAVSAGQATYALYVRNSTSALVVSHGIIIGGRGGAGTHGSNGDIGSNGGAGSAGRNARECANATCTTNGNAESQPGGAAGVNASCSTAVGCVGMEADTKPNNDSTPQTIDTSVQGCTYATGGYRSAYNSSDVSYCKYDLNPPSGGSSVGGDGTDGAAGNNGTGGTGCSANAGSIVNGVWTPGSAGSGTAGTPGKGGNGGSAGGWTVNSKSASCTIPAAGANYGDIGGSGGGGGAGGCGGSGGNAGTAGGASFAAFVIPSSASNYPLIRRNTIIRGSGGQGGNGGNGGAGGKGGAGGAGGVAQWPAWGAGIGGYGGRGGDGGAAGGGGGGCGGPSYGIAGSSFGSVNYSSENSFSIPNSTLTGGLGGAGGLSPSTGNGAAGSRGESSNFKAF